MFDRLRWLAKAPKVRSARRWARTSDLPCTGQSVNPSNRRIQPRSRMQKVAAVAGTSILRGTAGYNVVASTLLDARNHGAEEARAADQRR